jgi:hypothetical protein
MEKANQCIEQSQSLLYEGDRVGSLSYAIQAAQYLQLIRLFRETHSLPEATE